MRMLVLFEVCLHMAVLFEHITLLFEMRARMAVLFKMLLRMDV